MVGCLCPALSPSILEALAVFFIWSTNPSWKKDLDLLRSSPAESDHPQSGTLPQTREGNRRTRRAVTVQKWMEWKGRGDEREERGNSN
jgi:hypothetical protein